jgi:hypothetical protein
MALSLAYAHKHTDHAGVTSAHLEHIVAKYADKNGFFIDTFQAPEGLDPLPCGLYGPSMGDDAVEESEVVYAQRGARKGDSRMVARPLRPCRTITVIAGPNEDGSLPCVLYAIYGGPCAPREPFDTSMTEEQKEESVRFWATHALSLT